MNTTNKYTIAAIAALTIAPFTQAAVTLDAPPSGDFYVWEGTINATNSSVASVNTSISVGAWSYDNLDNAAKRGWGHTSSWFLLDLQQAAYFTLSMTATTLDLAQREAARPGFVLYAGSANEDNANEVHRYSNDGTELFENDGWDTGTKLSYVTHSTNTSGNSLSHGVPLAAGLYTIILGNSASASLAQGSPTYSVTFAVPEPSSALLGMIGVLTACVRRRRTV